MTYWFCNRKKYVSYLIYQQCCQIKWLHLYSAHNVLCNQWNGLFFLRNPCKTTFVRVSDKSVSQTTLFTMLCHGIIVWAIKGIYWKLEMYSTHRNVHSIQIHINHSGKPSITKNGHEVGRKHWGISDDKYLWKYWWVI